MPDYLEADAYLQVREHASWYRSEGRVVKVTQRRPSPEHVRPGCIVVKVKLRLPVAAFRPLEQEAVVTVPAELVQRPVLVIAEDPG